MYLKIVVIISRLRKLDFTPNKPFHGEFSKAVIYFAVYQLFVEYLFQVSILLKIVPCIHRQHNCAA